MKTLIASAVMLALSTCTAYALGEFRNKPVLCTPDKNEMLHQLNENNMSPLLGVNGATFAGMDDQGNFDTFKAYFAVAYNQETGQVSFIEFHEDGWACLMGGGREGIEFDSAEIDKWLGWLRPE